MFAQRRPGQSSSSDSNSANNPVEPKLTLEYWNYYALSLNKLNGDAENGEGRVLIPFKVNGIQQVFHIDPQVVTAPAAAGGPRTGLGDAQIYNFTLTKQDIGLPEKSATQMLSPSIRAGKVIKLDGGYVLNVYPRPNPPSIAPGWARRTSRPSRASNYNSRRALRAAGISERCGDERRATGYTVPLLYSRRVSHAPASLHGRMTPGLSDMGVGSSWSPRSSRPESSQCFP